MSFSSLLLERLLLLQVAVLVVLVLISSSCQLVDASITIVDSGKVLESKPEKNLGTKLWKGYEYIGRLQYIQTDLQLCKLPNEGDDEPFHIIPPPDGLPVALIAKTGGCDLEQKALVASTLMKPANLVAYLIVDDYGRKSKRTWLAEDDLDDDPTLNDYVEPTSLRNGNDPFWAEYSSTDEDAWVKSMWGEEEEETTYIPSDDEAFKFVQNLGDDVMIVSDDEASMEMGDYYSDDRGDRDRDVFLSSTATTTDDATVISIPTADEEPVDEYFTPFVTINDDATSIHEDEEPPQKQKHHRILRKHKKSSSGDDRINVAILHVSSKSGYELMDLVYKQDQSSMKAGGPKILLNNKNPSASPRTIFMWVMLTICFAGGGCCCLMALMSYGVEEPPAPPPRPVRRRLTYDQVRANFPAFRFNPEDHVECALGECAICLDEFDPGARCRKLPCDHIFHSACIGRWLIERSATCPLCKIDLYEEEESSSDEEEEGASSDAEAREPDQRAPFISEWWRSVERSLGTTVNPPTTAAAAPSTTGTSPTNATATAGPSPTVTASSSPSWSSWWNRRRRPSRPREGEDNTTTESRPRRAGIWRLNFFGRPPQRRGTEGMLTELTEPLMSGESAQQQEEGDAAVVAHGTAEQQQVVSEPTASREEQELDIIPSSSVEATTTTSTTTESAAVDSTAVEV